MDPEKHMRVDSYLNIKKNCFLVLEHFTLNYVHFKQRNAVKVAINACLNHLNVMYCGPLFNDSFSSDSISLIAGCSACSGPSIIVIIHYGNTSMRISNMYRCLE